MTAYDERTNWKPVQILPLVNYSVYWPIIGQIYCMASFLGAILRCLLFTTCPHEFLITPTLFFQVGVYFPINILCEHSKISVTKQKHLKVLLLKLFLEKNLACPLVITKDLF